MKNKIFKEDINKLRSEKEFNSRLSKTQTKETKWKYEIKKKKLNSMILTIN